MFGFLKSAPFKQRLPADQVDHEYNRLRWQVLIAIFVGYMGYYLARKNFSLAMPYLVQEGLNAKQLGFAVTALSISYGISKFVMGGVSDRSNPRLFLPLGLILSGVSSILIGMTSSLLLLTILMVLNGWFQGMGYPPCAKVMTHWFADKERGSKMGIWNVSHNLGGGIIGPIATLSIFIFGAWQSLFYFPAVIAILIGLGCLIFMRDTPQSCGLPAIEDWKNDHTKISKQVGDKELSFWEILRKFVLNNKYIWLLAIANIFVYMVRYGILDWCSLYLIQVKGATPAFSRWCYFFYEYAGIPSILISGWMSDRFFRGRRGPVSTISMAGVTGAVLLYWLNPAGNYVVDIIAISLAGFLIYVPVVLIGVAAIDLVPKNAAGTSTGFTGLFGYLFGASLAGMAIGEAVHNFGWDHAFLILLASCLLGTVLLAFTWNAHDRAEIAHDYEEIPVKKNAKSTAKLMHKVAEKPV